MLQIRSKGRWTPVHLRPTTQPPRPEGNVSVLQPHERSPSSCPHVAAPPCYRAETIGDLFVQNRVIESRATLDVIPIETAYSRNHDIDRAFTQATFIRACTCWAMTNAARPLNEMNQVIRPDAAPVYLLSLQKTEVATYSWTGSTKSH